MRPAPEPLARCNMLASSRAQLYEIMRATGERMWQVLQRLIEAEHRRRFPRLEEGLARGEEV